ncbi:DUF294 nucleotidyltransferase-like domain-containing protein [Lacimonas salitolerans]|uniref:DUF294 nucleotidyltransferase-like domain-containing protein n=1 Tax=Lacimonas salitolerans TaxID=1323750 RepID=A0ABW4ELI3_9RHOB
MPDDQSRLLDRVLAHAPFDLLPPEARAELTDAVTFHTARPGTLLIREGAVMAGLHVILDGALDILSDSGDVVSQRGPGDMLGERALFRGGRATLTARTSSALSYAVIDTARFLDLTNRFAGFAEWFRAAPLARAASSADAYATGLTALRVADLMVADPVTCAPDQTVTQVAQMMRDRVISSVLVMDGTQLAGIATVHDLTNKVLAEGLDGSIPVAQIMTPDPVTIGPDALGLDALVTLAGRKINHLPVAQGGRIVGMLGRTDLFRQQATTASHMVADIVRADSAEGMAHVMTRVPDLLAHLVSAGTRHTAITRRITDLTDAITRRLLTLAEEKFGPPPVPYLWLACGSQGRQEQTGISDQDNCLILDDAVQPDHDAYFAALAQFVSDGLDTCGFFYCPGDMMATATRWRQPRRIWRSYFAKWIAEPDPQAQMLASVMFDLRPIAGEFGLFADLQDEVLAKARGNSIFVAHMVSNSLKHTPPLSLFRGFALIRSGEHKNTVDLKLSGVIPVVDLARIYALRGALPTVNTRERLETAREAGVISTSGAHDLLDAYDLIAMTRLRHQAEQIRRGAAPDNFLPPGALSELERSHLRDAFMVIKTMQSALG